MLESLYDVFRVTVRGADVGLNHSGGLYDCVYYRGKTSVCSFLHVAYIGCRWQ
jgi:hypothetical protein